MQNYVFEYLNENEFKVKERTLRKYNKLAHKKLIFEYYVELKNGNFLGEIVDKKNNQISYELKIPTDKLFEKVHGEIRLHYTVYNDKGVILLTNITPEDILGEAHASELETYKGVILSKSNPQKDIFKVNLLNMLQK
jgi:hypothetical protein